MSENRIKLFEEKQVRAVWDGVADKWWFSVVDIISVLTDSANPQTYWRVMKKRLNDEGNETVTNCNALKMLAPDGKMRLTDAADTEQVLRLIQSIPSKKAESFKLWLAKIGSERIDETVDPEQSIDRAIQNIKRMTFPRFLSQISISSEFQEAERLRFMGEMNPPCTLRPPAASRRTARSRGA